MEQDDDETDLALRITALDRLGCCNHKVAVQDIIPAANAIYEWLKESGASGKDTVELQRVN